MTSSGTYALSACLNEKFIWSIHVSEKTLLRHWHQLVAQNVYQRASILDKHPTIQNTNLGILIKDGN